MAVCPLYGLSGLFHEFHLHLAVLLDLLMGEFDGFEHFGFAHFLHFSFHHHDVVVCGGHHEVDVGVSHLAEVRVDPELSTDPCHPYFGNRSSERNVAHGQCR